MATVGRLRILLAVHALPPDEYSGSPNVAAALARALAHAGADVAVLYPSEDQDAGVRNSVRPGDGFTRMSMASTPGRWQQWAVFEESRHNEALDPTVQELMVAIASFDPKIAVLLDGVHLPAHLPDVLTGLGIPIIRYTLHAEDICGMMDPLYADGPTPMCSLPITPEQCAACCTRNGVGRFPDVLVALEYKRQRQCDLYKNQYARTLFPTPGFRDFFLASMAVPRDRIEVLELGVDPIVIPDVPEWHPGDRVTFLYVGAVTPRKGAELIQEVFRAPEVRDRDDYRLVFHGLGTPALVDRLLVENPNVEYRGTFEPDDYPTILASGTVGLAPSYFESFHLVTRELLLAGIPVVGSRTGGISDIIEHRRNGLLFDVGDVEQLKAHVLRLLDEPTTIQGLRRGARETRVRSVADCAADVLRVVKEVRHTSGANRDIHRAAGTENKSTTMLEDKYRDLEVAYRALGEQRAVDRAAFSAYTLRQHTELERVRALLQDQTARADAAERLVVSKPGVKIQSTGKRAARRIIGTLRLTTLLRRLRTSFRRV